MFERGFGAETSQFLERLHPNLLHDVFNFTFPPGIPASCRENARRILLHERFEALGIASQDGGDQLRFVSFHSRQYARAAAAKSKNPVSATIGSGSGKKLRTGLWMAVYGLKSRLKTLRLCDSEGVLEFRRKLSDGIAYFFRLLA